MLRRHLLKLEMMSLLILAIVVLIAGCRGRGGGLVGRWEKISDNGCEYNYIPAPSEELNFFDDGTYVGSIFSIPGGTYEIVEGSRLKVTGRAFGSKRTKPYGISGLESRQEHITSAFVSSLQGSND